MYTLRDYLHAMVDADVMTRLGGTTEVMLRADGLPAYVVGNTAVSFRVRIAGRERLLRCYLKKAKHLSEIYGADFIKDAVFVGADDPRGGQWVDAVLTDWIEGETLRRTIERAVSARDRARLHGLAVAFDRLALSLVGDDWAHGDLKPENIVVDASNHLHLIDWDGLYAPMFHGEHSTELGTKAYQHPARTTADFDASLDDYPAALIATALHTLALAPEEGDAIREEDGVLFDPRKIVSDSRLEYALKLFEHEGYAAQYRIGKLLLLPTLRLEPLAELLRYALYELTDYTERHLSLEQVSYPALKGEGKPATEEWVRPTADDALELDVRGNLWGFHNRAGTWAIPPMYGAGFDFTEGLAAVRIEREWRYIDPTGRTAIHCPEYSAVKPFRRGRAVVQKQNRRMQIDPEGKEFGI